MWVKDYDSQWTGVSLTPNCDLCRLWVYFGAVAQDGCAPRADFIYTGHGEDDPDRTSYVQTREVSVPIGREERCELGCAKDTGTETSIPYGWVAESFDCRGAGSLRYSWRFHWSICPCRSRPRPRGVPEPDDPAPPDGPIRMVVTTDSGTRTSRVPAVTVPTPVKDRYPPGGRAGGVMGGDAFGPGASPYPGDTSGPTVRRMPGGGALGRYEPDPSRQPNLDGSRPMRHRDEPPLPVPRLPGESP